MRTFDQLAKTLLDNVLADPPAPREVVAYTSRRLLDFACCLKYGKKYDELLLNDEGIWELVALIKDSMHDDRVRDRYKTAKQTGDNLFAMRYGEALMKKTAPVDRRIDRISFLVKSLLFMNWEIPVLVPDLGRGFASMSDAEIAELLARFAEDWFAELADYDSFIDTFTPKRIEKDCARLGLKRTAQVLALANPH